MGIHVFPILNPPPPPSPSILYHASNLDWRFVSHMIFYIFQCHSPKSSHPYPLTQSPKDCSIHLCLFCCLTYRVIVNHLSKFHIHELAYCIGVSLSGLLLLGAGALRRPRGMVRGGRREGGSGWGTREIGRASCRERV